jgi:hypothetical protein
MNRYKVEWHEKHRAFVNAKDEEEAIKLATEENMKVESCQDQYDIEIEMEERNFRDDMEAYKESRDF